MRKISAKPLHFDSISELHKVLGFPKPLHPFISLVNYADIKVSIEELPKVILLNFYKISYKKNLNGKLRYGQKHYDFAEGGLSFTAPNQVISGGEDGRDYAGYTLLIHADFLRNYSLNRRIKAFGFFSYTANEALFVSESEKQIIFNVFDNIKNELQNNIDDFSHDLLISYIEVLLNYSNRFYKRQFITRRVANHDLLSNLETMLEDYFEKELPSKNGLPKVEFLAEQLNLSPRYLSDVLRSLDGRSAQQHIHDKLIEKAKEYLSSTSLSVSEIAYKLGFEHSQSFNKLFRKKTRQTPKGFRELFN